MAGPRISSRASNWTETFKDEASGKDAGRLQLEEPPRFLGNGEILVGHCMDRRLARTHDDLHSLAKSGQQRCPDRGRHETVGLRGRFPRWQT